MRNAKTHTRAQIIRAKFCKAIGGSCRLYSLLQRKFVERLDNNDAVESFETNVVLDGLPIEGVYSTDVLVKYKDGSAMAYECVLRRHISKPQTVKLLSLSRTYWINKGVNFGLVTEVAE